MTPDRAPGRNSVDNSVRIDDRCTACGNCLVTCPTHALRRAPKKPWVIDDRCTSCGACIEVCPVGAISDVLVDSAGPVLADERQPGGLS